MKLIHAIIQAEDTNAVCEALNEKGFVLTKIKSIGGFLQKGNNVIMMGVEDEQLDTALEIIKNNCEKRMVKTPIITQNYAPGYMPPMADVPVGGAIVFVTNVEKYIKM